MSTDNDPTPSSGGASSSTAAAMLNQPIVIDCGSASMKAGFAGGTKPKVVIGTKVGRAKHQRVMPGGALEGEEHQKSSSGRSTGSSGISSYYVGRKLDEHRGAFLLEYPMERGRVVDGGWDAMELLWEHIYSKNNLNAKMDEHPVLLTEPPHNPTSHREQLAELFFETFRSPALFVAPPAVLSLYASGRTTGVVLDVGEGVTHCIPVYEGHALPHSIVRSDVAGSDVTRRLQLLLRKGGLAFSTTAESDFCSTMKEEVCYVSNVPTKEDGDYDSGGSNNNNNGGDAAAKAQYQLPDGQVVDLASERHRSSEVLFNPSLIGSEERPVHDVLLTSILRSDMDLRSTLFSNVVLSGGTTLLPGFGDRLLYEARSRAPERTRIRISAPPERKESAWVGGSILASLATFKNMWVGRSEYEEYGSSILHRGSL
mmetsp:Transcript_18334/g.32785  ORF Transcript_18334/g.32785 Transcript_18334/m.32785 type:complete len:427 (+) Transcript_18334:109-1389(+)